MWPKNVKQRRGTGGIACMIKHEIKTHAHIIKEDVHKRFMWVHITPPNGTSLYVTGCYIPHYDSPFYANLDKHQPYAELEEDIAHFKCKGEVIVLGDMNARTASKQLDADDFMTHTLEWDNHANVRTSMDIKEPDSHGKALIHMCNNTGMAIANGTRHWPETSAYTCRRYNGESVIDYLLTSEDAIHLMKGFTLGAWNPESDHRTLLVDLHWYNKMRHANQQEQEQDMRIHMDFKKAPQYMLMVEHALDACTLDTNASLMKSWETFKVVISTCMEKCFAKKKHKGHARRRCARKEWFDLECQLARKHLLSLDAHIDKKRYRECALAYHNLTRCKRRRWEVEDNIMKAKERVHASGKFWSKLKRKPPEKMEELTPSDMYAHCKALYSQQEPHTMPKPENLSTTPTFFTLEDITRGLKKMATRKAGDLQGFKSEMLKWAGKAAQEWICLMFNMALQHGMPYDWTTNWIKPLHKGGDTKEASNYRTIMVGSIMAKLFGCVMEMKLSTWAESNNKRAHGQAGFRKSHSTIDHLVTLRVLMEESRLAGKGLYCCFVDFKKAFDTVPRDNLWKRMEELQVPLEYMHAVARLYEQVICQIRMGGSLSDTLSSDIGVKQGCPLSPTLFGLCIDRLEHMVHEHAHKEGITNVLIGNAVLLLLLYADDVVLFTHSVEDAQKMMEALKAFCAHSGLEVNKQKTKIMLVKTRRTEQPLIMYNEIPLESVENFKYLGLEISANYKWHGCAMRRLEAGKRAYYAFENMCNHGNIKSWTLKKYLFDALVIPVILYGVEVWGGSISNSTWKDFEGVQKRFLTTFLKVKSQTPYRLLLLETGTLPIEIMGIERVTAYMLKVKTSPQNRLPHIAWEASNKVQKTHKSKLLSTGWMLDISKWFKKWDAHHLLNNASKDIMVNEAFLQRQCLTKWEDEGGSRWTHYTTHIAPNYKNLFFLERNHRTQPYILEPIPISAIRTLAAIRLSSHHLRCETGRWGMSDPRARLCMACGLSTLESEYHTLIECAAYTPIRESFPHLFKQAHTLESFLSQPSSTLAIATFITKALAHRETTTTLQHV